MPFVVASLAFTGDAASQCAVKASQCAVCHATSDRAPERRAKADWHRDHAIGDFCAGCHGGDAGATSEPEAHAGLVHPLADPARTCAGCHADKTEAFAQRYAARLAERTPEAAPPRPRASSRNGVVAAIAAVVAAAGAVVIAWNERRRRKLAEQGSS